MHDAAGSAMLISATFVEVSTGAAFMPPASGAPATLLKVPESSPALARVTEDLESVDLIRRHGVPPLRCIRIDSIAAYTVASMSSSVASRRKLRASPSITKGP